MLLSKVEMSATIRNCLSMEGRILDRSEVNLYMIVCLLCIFALNNTTILTYYSQIYWE